MRVVVAGAGFAGLLAEFVLDGYDLMQDECGAGVTGVAFRPRAVPSGGRAPG